VHGCLIVLRNGPHGPNLSIVKTGKARAIRFSTLEAICEALGYHPGDILKFESDEAEQGAEV
jgi:DNA-binding Xre family transcriptional regulator